MTMTLSGGRRIKKIAVYSVVLVYLAIVLIPLYWMFRSSISVNAEMYGERLSILPSEFTLAQFDQALNKWHFGLFLQNTIVVAIMTTVLTTVVATLAAYSLVWSGRTDPR